MLSKNIWVYVYVQLWKRTMKDQTLQQTQIPTLSLYPGVAGMEDHRSNHLTLCCWHVLSSEGQGTVAVRSNCPNLTPPHPHSLGVWQWHYCYEAALWAQCSPVAITAFTYLGKTTTEPNNVSHNFKDSFTCSSSNVIYIIIWQQCPSAFCLGQTGQSLHKGVNGYKSDINMYILLKTFDSF